MGGKAKEMMQGAAAGGTFGPNVQQQFGGGSNPAGVLPKQNTQPMIMPGKPGQATTGGIPNTIVNPARPGTAPANPQQRPPVRPAQTQAPFGARKQAY